MKRFAGWVPTITGQLSFSLIGLRTGSLNCITANGERLPGASPPHRSVVVLLKRVTRDVPFLVRIWQPARIKHCILLGSTSGATRPSLKMDQVSSHSDEIGVLSGQIYVAPHHRNPDRHKRMQAAIKDIRARILANRNNSAALQIDIETKLKSIPDVRLLFLEFELYRTGELRIISSDEHPEDLCSQVYYFIKDIAHRHYHHDRGDDNILPLTPAPTSDDSTWRRNTLWCLARAVLEARRRDRIDGYKSALGILAYAEAFQGLLGRVQRNTENNQNQFSLLSDTANYDFAHTRSSLEAKIAEQEHILNARSHATALWISTALATFALWISAVQIKDTLCTTLQADRVCSIRTPIHVSELLKIFIEKPHWAYGCLLFLFMGYLGRRILALQPASVYDFFVRDWSYNIAATVSRFAGANDKIGALVGAISALLIGILLIIIISILSGIL